jgi:hypothetical protein
MYDYGNDGSGVFKLLDHANTHFVVDNNGLVGIGTDAPDANLDVRGAADFENVAETVQVRLNPSSAIPRFGTKTNTAIALMSNDVDRLTITADGKVGIGTNVTGAARLVVSDANGGYITAYPDDGGLEIGSGNNAGSIIDFKGSTNLGTDFQGRIGYTDGLGMFFHTNADSTAKMKIDESGYVGIATNSPGQELSVNGDSTVSGYLSVGRVSGFLFFITGGNQ